MRTGESRSLPFLGRGRIALAEDRSKGTLPAGCLRSPIGPGGSGRKQKKPGGSSDETASRNSRCSLLLYCVAAPDLQTARDARDATLLCRIIGTLEGLNKRTPATLFLHATETNRASG